MPCRNFNPRSREGSDVERGCEVKCGLIFQSTLPRGERLLWACATRSSRAISIHAPARGATITPFHLGQTIRFQSTLPRGERPDRPSSLLSGRIFQSTLPRGERHGSRDPLIQSPIFQSTLPRGERQRIPHVGLHAVSISIHAPARGATPKLTKKPISNWQNSTKGYLHFSKIHQNQAFLHAYLANAP